MPTHSPREKDTIDTLQTFSPREEIKQQGVQLTGTENLSATLPRQLEGRTKKRQPDIWILRKWRSFEDPLEIVRNSAGTSDSLNTSAFGVLRESFGIPQNLRASFGILRDPSGIIRILLASSGSCRNLGILWESFGILRESFGILWDPSGILRDPSGIL